MRRREVPFEESGEPDPATIPQPDELLLSKSAREQLDVMLEALSQEQRAIFVLYEFEELSTAEIATQLALPMGTVASRLRRAREIVEQRIARLQARDWAPRKEAP
jgi:RNA polymerase sigma-70 factor (ECF subfamily)